LVLLPSGRQGNVPAGLTLLEAARQLGVELESICGGRQTCGKCQVVIETGEFAKHAIRSEEDHVSPMEAVEAEYCRANGIEGRRLACAARMQGDLVLNVPEESQARKQIVAKAASDRVIEVQPAVRQVYVELPPASLADGGSAWNRLQQALADQWSLPDLDIDLAALDELSRTAGHGTQALSVSVWQGRRVIRIQAGYAEGVYGLAIDVGSTTVVVHLCDLRTGAVLSTQAGMNPQVRFGEDLMSRVSFAMTNPQGAERMRRAVLRALNELIEAAVAAAGIAKQDILDAVLVGNPIMHHLAIGLDPASLGGAPFEPAISQALELKASEVGLELHPAARLYLPPLIAGHVGADHIAALLAEAPADSQALSLLVDVGTNAEMSVGNSARMQCASSPTGPAFEGAQISHGQRAAAGAIERVRIDPVSLEPRYRIIGLEGWVEDGQAGELALRATGICGSGIIEAVAELFLSGIIDADGRFAESAAGRSDRVKFDGRSAAYLLVGPDHSASGKGIYITQGDVRAIQLAKAALYAGVKLLMRHGKVDRLDRVMLAGAFGTFIDPRYAMILGMIPDCALDQVAAVGNAAGDGARLALLNVGERARARHLATWVQHVQTATEADFQDEFVAAMAIPHARDAFPHLEGMLPKQQAGAERRSQRRRRHNDGARTG
jgi:uncharacterized 2Fe-2S/4Fe-4S cluster protein (DUF4445 family)